MAIDPSMAVSGSDWGISGLTDASGSVAGGEAQPSGNDTGFGDMLSGSMKALSATQTEAATASQALAAGTVQDPTEVVMAVERARLSMQLAAQLRTKGVEAFQEIFRTQV